MVLDDVQTRRRRANNAKRLDFSTVSSQGQRRLVQQLSLSKTNASIMPDGRQEILIAIIQLGDRMAHGASLNGPFQGRLFQHWFVEF